MLLRCPKCGYVWNYKGKRLTATCPNCRHTVVVRKAVVDRTVIVMRVSDLPRELVETIDRCIGVEPRPTMHGEKAIAIRGIDQFVKLIACVYSNLRRTG